MTRKLPPHNLNINKEYPFLEKLLVKHNAGLHSVDQLQTVSQLCHHILANYIRANGEARG